MACLPLPDSCPADQTECYNSEHKPCNIVDDKPPHDPTCAWHCKAPVTTTTTDPSSNATTDPSSNATTTTTGPTPEPEDKFCDGGMDMLMGGFEVAGGSTSTATKTCVILFFKSWKLNSIGKFAAACIGVFFLGLGIEGLICLRRKIVNRKRFFINIPMALRKIVVIALFGTNLILGYLAMLVAMTYSVELFLCVVVGLILGHALFNSHTPVGETIDPCCASQNHNDSSAAGDEHPPSSRVPCDNVVYQEMATNGAMGHNDGDTHSLCNCEDANSNTNIKV